MQPMRGLILGLFGILALGVSAVAGCGPGFNGPPVTITTNPNATAPAIPAGSSFSAAQSVIVSQPTAVPLPTGGGYGGSISVPTPSGTAPAGGVTLAEQLSSSPIYTGLPSLALARQTESARSALSVGVTPLVYFAIASSATITFPDAPAIALTVPSAAIVPDVAYYLALYDLLRPSLGWQLGFEGPASISGTLLIFAAPSPAVPFTLTAQVPDYFALYAVSVLAPTPTPAPVASTTPAPTPTPLAALSVAPTSLSLLAAGATATATLTDPSSYSGGYTVASSASSVATATISGKTITVTAVAAGTATITVSDTNARTASISVSVTTTTLPLQ